MGQVLDLGEASTSGRLGVRPAVVVWEDAAHQSGWLEGEEVAAQDCLVETVGWLMDSNDRVVVVAQSLTEGAHAHTLQIPAGMVRSIIMLGK